MQFLVTESELTEDFLSLKSSVNYWEKLIDRLIEELGELKILNKERSFKELQDYCADPWYKQHYVARAIDLHK